MSKLFPVWTQPCPQVRWSGNISLHQTTHCFLSGFNQLTRVTHIILQKYWPPPVLPLLAGIFSGVIIFTRFSEYMTWFKLIQRFLGDARNLSMRNSYITSFSSYSVHKGERPRCCLGIQQIDDNTPSAFWLRGINLTVPMIPHEQLEYLNVIISSEITGLPPGLDE